MTTWTIALIVTAGYCLGRAYDARGRRRAVFRTLAVGLFVAAGLIGYHLQ